MNDETTAQVIPPDKAPVVRKAPLVATGGRPMPIIVQDIDQAYRYAGLAVAAKWTKMNRDEATMAILHGAEIGLTPIMSLQSIAIIDNKPAIYGDAVPGIALSTGQLESWEERIEGEDDAMEAVCVIKRKGLALPIEVRFSVADAKQANLWGKTNWKHYPKAMLKARARAAFRLAFADAFKGLPLAEEIDERPIWRTVDNPLGESPQVVDSRPQQRQDVFQEDGDAKAPAEPAQEVIDPETGEVTTPGETAPEAAAGAAQAYLAAALAHIANALDAQALMTWWRTELGARLAAGVSEEQMMHLVDAYDAKCGQLQGEGT